jgi:presenilin-like A22 family membrane protease
VPDLVPEPREPAEPRSEPDEDGAELGAAAAMGLIFVGTILLAMFFAELLQGEVPAAFEDPQDPTNPLLYLGLVIVFTAGILLVAKLGLDSIIQAVVLGAVFLTMVYLYRPLIQLLPGVGFDAAFLSSLALGAALTALLFFYPEWYVVDAAAISVGAGATGLFGFSFGIVPALVLLVAFAVYDAIAVYRTEHMLDLADSIVGLRLPVMLVVPKVADYSFREEIEPDEDPEDPPQSAGRAADRPPTPTEDVEPEPGGQDALFMGLGDIVIPGVLVVSSSVFLHEYTPAVDAVAGLAAPTFVALTTLLGATVGFAFLMRSVLEGSPHAGLPALNGGALLGFLGPVLWLYGVAPLVPQF